jgi:aspartate/methionine/tyrosine aminotransferase
MKQAAADALFSRSNQYPPMVGVPELRSAIAAHALRHSGQRVSADEGGVLVTSGATEGIAAALLGLCNRGDRVVVFEPLYDAYAGIAAAAGVELAPVRLRPPRWDLPPPAAAAAAAAAATAGAATGADGGGGGGAGRDAAAASEAEAEVLAAAEAEAEAAAAAAEAGAGAGGDGDNRGASSELARAFFPTQSGPGDNKSKPAKLVILNTPHNPTGKVFSFAELARVAAFVKRANALALLDEVYEHLVHPPPPPPGRRHADSADAAAAAAAPHVHVSLASLPGMFPRCVRLGSAGKTFSFTAWKVGWATGPPQLIAPMAKCHQFLTFTTPTSMQLGVALGLEQCQSFYLGLGAELAAARRAFAPRVAALGFRVLPAQATYFLVADAAAFASPREDDVAFCRRLASEGGVALIPVSAFYLRAPPDGGGGDGTAARPPPPPPRTLVRFAFCKSQPVLDAAVEKLERYLGRPGKRGVGARGDAAFGEAAAREQGGGAAAL